MPAPTKLPEWATAQAALIQEPSTQKKQQGWTTDTNTPQGQGEKPPLQYFNWYQNLVYQWIQYLSQAVGGLPTFGTMAQQNANNVNILDGNIVITQNGSIKSYGEALRILQSGGNAGIIFQRKDETDYLAAGYYNDSNIFFMGSYNGGGAALEIDTAGNKINFPNGAKGVFRTGMSIPFWGSTSSVPEGFIPWIDGTIGSSSSGATIRANPDTLALYTLLWNSASDVNCPVTGGRGASAAADFSANKAIRVPRANGMVIGIAGTASTAGSITTSARNLADKVGEETHTLTVNEMPTHNHQNGTASDLISGSEHSSTGVQAGVNGGQKALDILPQGGSQSHNNMQPTTFVTWIVAL